MNMFKRGRKAKDEETYEALTRDNSPHRSFKASRTMRRKNKKQVEEEQPTLDLNNALPNTDDFRTSLLMPGLSARFSMLREQDDPNTVIGKASDDSVLFPKSGSRMNLFGHSSPLADIAEVESIRSGFRPPFADRDRSNSFGGDGYDSDSGSVMSRARPGEGNVLFGGRQKLYRIPTASTRTLNEPETGAIAAKHIYDHDASLSLFQQYRFREREQSRSEEENRDSQTMELDETSSVQSPSTAFSKKRGTQSSTNSGRSALRASTAATSVASESPVPRDSDVPLNGVAAKLMTDSPNTSNDSFQPASSPGLRKRRNEGLQSARQLSPTKSTPNLRDRSQRSGAIFTTSAFRSISPPRSAGMVEPLDFGFDNKENILTSSLQRKESKMVQSDEVLAKSVQPNDHGKATALGLFNKPAREFDEHQYSQRQLQMHEGRNSPFSINSRSGSAASNDGRKGSSQDNVSRASPIPADRSSTPPVPPMPSQPASPISAQRGSRASNASGGRGTPPRPRSKSSASATAKDNVKARVESLIRRQNAELAALEAEKMPEFSMQKSFFIDEPKEVTSVEAPLEKRVSSSSEEVNEPKVQAIASTSNVQLPDSDIHPAFRSEVKIATSSNHSNFSKSVSIAEDNLVDGDDAVSNQYGLGLSGLIRTHLRHDSGRSSILPPVSTRISVAVSDHPGHDSVQSLSKSIGDTTSNDVFGSHTTAHHLTTDNTEPAGLTSSNRLMEQKAERVLEHASTPRDGVATNVASQADREDETIESLPQRDSWREEKEPSHGRSESSETTKERREFDEELAARRRRIQEGLKSVSERERSTSPAPPRGRDLRMEAFAHSQDLPMRSQAGRPIAESRGSDEHRGRNHSALDNHAPTSRQASSHSRQDGSVPPQSRSITPSSGRPVRRDRSDSEMDGRPKSRNRHAHEFRPPMPGSFPSQTSSGSQPTSPMLAQGDNPLDRSNFNRSLSAMASRNGYRAASSPIATNLNMSHSATSSPRPSPISPVSPYASSQHPAYNGGQYAPSSNRRTPPIGLRKRSGTNTQISEPTFLSSTSSVNLIPLPSADVQSAPPLPDMHPRRRGNSAERPHPTLTLSNLARSPLATVPASPRFPETEFQQAANEPVSGYRPRQRLRKSSSEGGNLAAKARYHAMEVEMAHERKNSPAVPVFPNRSATALGLSNEGAMF